VKVGDLVHENFEGVGVVTLDPYVYKSKRPVDDPMSYDVVMVMFSHGTFEVDCDELIILSASR
tara:strand:- start:405 stop:593 length:189 start_codon:yes stop_codon:yes gene_type:complete